MSQKKENSGSASAITIIITAVLFLILLVWFISALIKSDRREIGRKELSSAENSSSEVEQTITADEIDMQKLRQSYAYTSIDGSMLNFGVLSVSQDNSPQKLTPVYNSLFTADGLQIASEKSVKFKCDTQMSAPLSEMLNAFYEETGLRTLMINAAYSEPTEADNSQEQDEYADGYYDENGYFVKYEQPAAEETPNETCGEHENGLSVDFGLYIAKSDSFLEFTGEGEYSWFESNSWKYGFILRYPEDKQEFTENGFYPAHFRYVGRAAAAVMKQQNLCLEEFLTYIKGYSYDSPLIVQTENGAEILYYIGDSGLETTDAQVPANSDGTICDFTVSGNGADGYILTAVLTDEFAADSSSEDSVQAE